MTELSDGRMWTGTRWHPVMVTTVCSPGPRVKVSLRSLSSPLTAYQSIDPGFSHVLFNGFGKCLSLSMSCCAGQQRKDEAKERQARVHGVLHLVW